MAEKKIKTRIQQKHDIEANWNNATTFKPYAGEVIIYDADSVHPHTRFKIGDGNTTVANLPIHDTIYNNTDPLLQNVGGILATNHTNGFSNVPITDLITELLYPYTQPAISSFTLNTAAGVKEKGTTVTVSSASAYITKKSKPVTSVKLYRGATEVKSMTGQDITGTVTFSNLSQSVTSDTTFYIKASDGTRTSSASATYTFVSPYYTGVIRKGSSISSTLITGLTKTVETKGTKTFTYTTTADQCAVIAYPYDYGELSGITDANDFTQTWSKSTTTINGVSYYVYVSGAAAATNFSYTFKY